MFEYADFPKPTRIPVNGIELEVFEAGQENKGNPIVLCHGWPEHAYAWRFQMPVLAKAGYHVIVPNQRGFGGSSSPESVAEFGIEHLTADLASLLDHFGYESATFVGHDWGANVVWSMAMLHPARVDRLINLALPYQQRGEKPWIQFMEELFGADNYFVHFNRQPGVADAVFEAHTKQFFTNLFRKNVPLAPPEPGMMLINLAQAKAPLGDAIMTDADLEVFVAAYAQSGFTGGINWYRNLDQNWHFLADVEPVIKQPALMIYGEKDMIPQSENLAAFVPNVEVKVLDAGHWIQQEQPEATNAAILTWLESQRTA